MIYSWAHPKLNLWHVICSWFTSPYSFLKQFLPSYLFVYIVDTQLLKAFIKFTYKYLIFEEFLYLEFKDFIATRFNKKKV